MSQASVLNTLGKKEMTTKEIAEKSKISFTTASQCLKRLEKSGDVVKRNLEPEEVRARGSNYRGKGHFAWRIRKNGEKISTQKNREMQTVRKKCRYI